MLNQKKSASRLPNVGQGNAPHMRSCQAAWLRVKESVEATVKQEALAKIQSIFDRFGKVESCNADVVTSMVQGVNALEHLFDPRAKSRDIQNTFGKLDAWSMRDIVQTYEGVYRSPKDEISAIISNLEKKVPDCEVISLLQEALEVQAAQEIDLAQPKSGTKWSLPGPVLSWLTSWRTQ